MTKLILTISILSLSFNSVLAQDIHTSEVPSVILNNFQKNFPKATDIDWELKGNLYEVEFETGLFGYDNKILYTRDGRLVKREEEISKNNLPKAVIASIKKNYPNYRIDDVKKISKNGKIMYNIELKNYSTEWKILVNSQGNILQKRED